jgi:hypothetical protein
LAGGLLMTQKDNLKLMQAAVKVKAYIEGLELMDGIDGLTAARLVTLAFERKYNNHRMFTTAGLTKDLEAYENSLAVTNNTK